jgi:hypothetical protein
MKTNTAHLLALGAALLLAPLSSTFAQSWEPVDNFAPGLGRDIVCDASGNFFSLALSDANILPVFTTVRASTDHGLNWHTVGTIGGYALDLAAAPDGTLFAAGNRTATVSGRAAVWQSLDHGTTWTASDPWAGQTTQLLCTDVAAGNSGAVYLSAYILSGSSQIVRKGQPTANGLTWSTVNLVSGNQASAVYVQAGPVDQPDIILVGGQPGSVRRSSDSGATWVTIDSYPGKPTAITMGPSGSIYVLGQGSVSTTVTNTTIVGKKVKTTITTTSQDGWLVRKSTNVGASWTNADFFANRWPPYNITADAFGGVFTVGFVETATGQTWIVRGSSDGGATWTTTDLFQPVDTTQAHAQGVACDALGNVCVSGEYWTSAGINFAPIRRLAAP